MAICVCGGFCFCDGHSFSRDLFLWRPCCPLLNLSFQHQKSCWGCDAVCSDFSAGFNLSLAFVLSLASRWITAVIWYHTLFLNHNAFLFGGPMKYWCFIALEFKFVQYVLFRLFCFVYFFLSKFAYQALTSVTFIRYSESWVSSKAVVLRRWTVELYKAGLRGCWWVIWLLPHHRCDQQQFTYS